MGKCWKCDNDVFLREEETRCDKCKTIMRYWCNSCAEPFDVEDKHSKKKLIVCKWCGYFKCPHCSVCYRDCKKVEYQRDINKIISPFIRIDCYNDIDKIVNKIVDYFEEVKVGFNKTSCEFGVPKTYAKDKIKNIYARIEGFKTRDESDRIAFEKKYEEVLDEDEGYEFTINKSRDNGSYGQEYRDVFNFGVCMGKLKYMRKVFLNKQGIEIGYDSWTRIEESPCKYLDLNNIIVKECPNCKEVFSKDKTYCNKCIYTKGSKKHEKGNSYELKERLSNNPTCKNLNKFKTKGESKDGESEFEGDSKEVY